MQNKGKTFSELSIDTKIIYDKLLTVRENETITYKEISELIYRDITKHRGLLYSALNLARRENQMVFDCVPKVGMKRLANNQIVSNVRARTLAKIKRVSSLAYKKVTATDYDKLNKEERIQHNATVSFLGAIKQIATEKTVQKLESALTNKPQLGGTLAIGQTLDLFRS